MKTKIDLARVRAAEERQMAEHYRKRAAEFRTDPPNPEEAEVREAWAAEADLEAEIFEDTVRHLESLERETV